jgi:hypothetical protein
MKNVTTVYYLLKTKKMTTTKISSFFKNSRKMTIRFKHIGAFILLSFLAFNVNVKAQAPPIAWEHLIGGTGNDDSYAIQQTFTGGVADGYIIAGTTASSDGDVASNHGGSNTMDVYLIRLNLDGTLRWTQTIGGSKDDIAKSIKQTADGGYILTGYTYSNDGDVHGKHVQGNTADIWVVKIKPDAGNSFGGIDWDKCFGGTSDDFGYSVRELAGGGYIVTGEANSTDADLVGTNKHAGSDMWVFKLTATGSLLWSQCFGGSGEDFGYSIESTTDGGYIATGKTASGNGGGVDGDVVGKHGGDDIWVVKIKPDVAGAFGGIQWQHCFGGSGNEESAGNTGVQQTMDGGYILLGYTTSSNSDEVGSDPNGGSGDYWVVKINPDTPGFGGIQWAVVLGSNNMDDAHSIVETKDGGFAIAGTSNSSALAGSHGGSDMWIMRLDKNGVVQWTKVIGSKSDEGAEAIFATADGGYVIAGFTNSASDNGDVGGTSDFVDNGRHDDPFNNKDDIWIVKLGPDPLILSAKFGHVDALNKNGQLQINWSTLSETNVDHFDVEASADGNSFAKIGEVKTQAQDGNSNAEIDYSFSKTAASASGLLGISMFALAFGFTKRRRIGLSLIACGMLLFAAVACSKKEAPLDTAKGTKIFVRIKQIDTNGGVQYSKVIQAVKE